MNQNHEDTPRVPELHEKLCAYVLGEAPDEVRAEVEAALEQSEELRAERERLEATIGLVQRALIPAVDPAEGEDGDEQQASADRLSPTAAAALMAAAEARRPAGKVLRGPAHWYRSPVLKLAAGIAAIGLVFAAYRELASEEHVDTSPFTYTIFGGEEGSSTVTAALEQKTEEPRADQLEELRALGYTDGGSSRQTPKQEALNKTELDRLRELGYSGDDDSGRAVAVGFDVVPGGDEAKRREEAQALRDSVTGAKVSHAEWEQVQARMRALGYTDGTDMSSQPTATEVAAAEPPAPEITIGGGAGGKFGGRFGGQAKDQPVALAANEPGAPSAGSTPIPVRTGPASPGPSGPGAPASAQLRAGAVVTGSDDFFLGHGEKEDAGQAPERLRRLGYSGGDASAPIRDEVTGADFDGNQPVLLDSEEDGLESLGYLGESREDHERARLQRRFDFVLGCCRPRPDERPRDMFFRLWGDNPFETTILDAQSTFSVDVDTASYTLARRYLVEGHLPEKAQIRTEEFVNYFDADVPAPLEETFRIATELAPSRFGEGPDSWMLRVAVRGKDVSREERQPLTLTFVIDVSGSMKGGNRLELVKYALRLLLTQLDARDSIAIVAFSNEARTILPMTSARNRDLIETAIHQLRPEGGTNAEAGVLMGYALAAGELTRNSHNRVVLLSDGVANIGNTDQATISAQVERQRKAGIYLNTVGVGMGNHNDALLEQLADKGDGVCNYVDDEAEARRALVERFTGAFEPIARDVKIQVEFDPAQVQRYRLLGYENRAIADRDFRNDAVDAGEVNAGHQVVALYELEASPRAGAEGPLATVRLRWKPPHAAGIASADTEVATEIEQPVRFADTAPSFAAASAGYRLSVLAGQFAEFLRRSRHARNDSVDELLAETRALSLEPGMRDDADVAELVRLIERSRQLILAERARYDDLERALDSIRESCYLQSQLEDLNLRLGRDRLFELEDAVRELQQRIRLLRERLQVAEFGLDRAELERFRAENARLQARLEAALRELAERIRRR